MRDKRSIRSAILYCKVCAQIIRNELANGPIANITCCSIQHEGREIFAYSTKNTIWSYYVNTDIYKFSNIDRRSILKDINIIIKIDL